MGGKSKTLLTGSLALLVALVLAACGGDSGTDAAQTDANGADSGTTSAEAPQSPDGQQGGGDSGGDGEGGQPDGEAGAAPDSGTDGSGGDGGSGAGGSGNGSGNDGASGDGGSSQGAGSSGRGQKKSNGGKKKQKKSGGTGGSGGGGAQGGSAGQPSLQAPPNGPQGIRGFGSEASAAERQAVSVGVELLGGARRDDDGRGVCAELANPVLEAFEKVAELNDKYKGKGCAALFATGASQGVLPQFGNTISGPISGLRVKGSEGYALYSNGAGQEYALQMVREGSWKVGAPEPLTLS